MGREGLDSGSTMRNQQLFLLICFASTLVLSFPQDNVKSIPDARDSDSPYLIVEDISHNSSDTQEDRMEDEEEKSTATCDQIMANNGLNFTTFWKGVGHAIHSMVLEEIREYFEPDAPVNNKIPVVNKDMSAVDAILFDAPLAGYDEDFHTMALKVMAYFMINDKPTFYLHGVNTLEKITHQYHMHEIYKAAAPIYQRIKENPPTDEKLCGCVNDVTGNGILSEVANVAKTLKYYGSKRTPRARGGNFGTYCGGDTFEKYCGGGSTFKTYGCSRPRASCGGAQLVVSSNRQKRSDDDRIAEYEAAYLANSSPENARQLLNVRPWVSNSLEGPEQWVSYEAMLTYSMLTQEQINDFATFMYCKLNQGEQEQLIGLF